MFVSTLCPCLSSFPQKPEANPARSTCHESREGAVTGTEIALHNMSHRDTEHRKTDNTATSSTGDS